ncbi:MAG: helix-turn-helix domain-containing protein [Chryseotalea sp.]|jgi:hypothetical protein
MMLPENPTPEMRLLLELFKQQQEEMRSMLTELLAQQSNSNKTFLSVKQFANKIGMSITQVRYWCETGQIKAIQPGGDGTKWKIFESELERLKHQAKENNHSPLRSRKLKAKHTLPTTTNPPMASMSHLNA